MYHLVIINIVTEAYMAEDKANNTTGKDHHKHLDEKYHAVPHFCYMIRCGQKRLFFTSDADYRLETFSFLGDAPLRAVFVNPLFFSDLQRRRFFRGSLPTETVVVYHLPFPPEDEKTLGRMFSRSLREWPENGPGVRVLECELETIEL